jgi:hypothetical protein
MRGAVPPLLQYVFVAWCLIKHRDNFTFTFTVLNTYQSPAESTVLLVSEVSVYCYSVGCFHFIKMKNNLYLEATISSLWLLGSVSLVRISSLPREKSILCFILRIFCAKSKVIIQLKINV